MWLPFPQLPDLTKSEHKFIDNVVFSLGTLFLVVGFFAHILTMAFIGLTFMLIAVFERINIQ